MSVLPFDQRPQGDILVLFDGEPWTLNAGVQCRGS